jgi:predicted HAD superfamily Cof-like phosphohydrolase
MSVTELMTTEQRTRLNEPLAFRNLKRLGFPLGATPFQMTGHFHQVMGLPAPEQPIVPPVSDRALRANLICEEFLELLDAIGFQLTLVAENGDKLWLDHKQISARHIEGSHYDVVETADALGDLNVVVNGTGVSFGIPMHFVDYEIYCSNLSKLDNDGNPIINECQSEENPDGCAASYGGEWCEHLPLPDAPVGKRLKGPNFVAPNIPRVLLAYENKEI